MPPPHNINGKICYIEIPADDVERSAEFYRKSFGWNIRRGGDGDRCAFDDTTGEVSGAWVVDRPPMVQPGPLIYILVDNIDEAVQIVTANGGQIVQEVGADAPEITARFADPAGNVIGLYQPPRD